MGYTAEEVAVMETEQEPGEKLIISWSQSSIDHTVDALISHLEEMGRVDLVSDLRAGISDESQRVLSSQGQESSYLNTMSTTSTTSQNCPQTESHNYGSARFRDYRERGSKTGFGRQESREGTSSPHLVKVDSPAPRLGSTDSHGYGYHNPVRGEIQDSNIGLLSSHSLREMEDKNQSKTSKSYISREDNPSLTQTQTVSHGREENQSKTGQSVLESWGVTGACPDEGQGVGLGAGIEGSVGVGVGIEGSLGVPGGSQGIARSITPVETTRHRASLPKS